MTPRYRLEAIQIEIRSCNGSATATPLKSNDGDRSYKSGRGRCIAVRNSDNERVLMNVRLQKYKANRLAGMNIYNAARAAGYSYNYARQAKPEKIAKDSMSDAFEQAGLTDRAIVAYGLQGLQANKVISANIIHGDADEKTNDFIEVPDWANRHRYFETILKLTDKLRDKVIDMSTHNHFTWKVEESSEGDNGNGNGKNRLYSGLLKA